ncbi:hypothetical protein LCGC14_2713770 [marine sediment metagenome]|uniref:Uncharacterized protein n=1 Tax=marine sediment metagenome TaxID=412755 RepID=A0A0F9BLA4_9ZZZZ
MPKIFIIMALILIAGAFGLWYTWDDGDGGTSAHRGGGVQAKAILLINPQAFADEPPEAMDSIVRSYAEKLNEPSRVLADAVAATLRRYWSKKKAAW